MSTTIDHLERSTTNEKNKEEYLFQSPPLLEIKDLSISLHGANGQKEKNVVRKLNLKIRPGEMLGLAGESGSGKSLTASAILGLLPKSLNVSDGKKKLRGKHIASLSEKEMRCMRGKDIDSLFQNY